MKQGGLSKLIYGLILNLLVSMLGIRKNIAADETRIKKVPPCTKAYVCWRG
tara:strand:+ start:488 stop:640 length:153 start_codon:yes stop_codon:yes gene_type:complete